MKKSIASLFIALTLGACDRAQFIETTESVAQEYKTMVTNDDTTYLRDKIHKDELYPLLPLIAFINEKQHYNENSPQRARFYGFRFTEQSIGVLAATLRPLEGYYTKENCSWVKNNEFVFFSPDVIAKFALEQSTLDKNSIKAKALAVQLKERLEQVASNKQIRSWLEERLKQNGVKIANDWEAYKKQIKQAMLDYAFDLDAFANPNVIYCSPLEYKQLKQVLVGFAEFNKIHKPLDFNEKFYKFGRYIEQNEMK